MATINRTNYTNSKDYWIAWIKNVYDEAIAAGKTKDAALKQMNDLTNLAIMGEKLLNRNAEAEAIQAALKVVGGTVNQVIATAGDFHFTGEKSGVMLEMFKGYPSNYPVLQLTEDQQLKWWSWSAGYPWLNFEQILWWPANVGAFPTGYYFTPLYNIELARFLIGFNQSRAGIRDQRFTASQVNAGRNNMFFRNEVVFIKDGVCYDPSPASYYVRLAAKQGTDNYYTGTDIHTVTSPANLTSLEGGYWAWKWMDGYEMLWRGVQYYIDNFLKVPYNVKELVAFGQSYEYQFKKAWQKNDDAKRGYLSVVNFLERPVGTQTFWDKFVNYIPLIFATAASVITAGLGSPLLIAAVGALSGQLIKAGKTKAAADAQKIYDDALLRDTGGDKEKIEEAKNNIESNANSGNNFLWIAGALAILFIFNRKNKKR